MAGNFERGFLRKNQRERGREKEFQCREIFVRFLCLFTTHKKKKKKKEGVVFIVVGRPCGDANAAPPTQLHHVMRLCGVCCTTPHVLSLDFCPSCHISYLSQFQLDFRAAIWRHFRAPISSTLISLERVLVFYRYLIHFSSDFGL